MENPWSQIPLSDYEHHMELSPIQQLQTLNAIMKRQFGQTPIQSAMVLGVAGGNGLEHADPKQISRVYGVDLNQSYLDACAQRYPNLKGVLTCICADLTEPDITLPHADLVIADLLVEYIGCACFQRVIGQTAPRYVSCAIQISSGLRFVSDSPYLHTFDGLDTVLYQVDAQELTEAMVPIGYRLAGQTPWSLPNGKQLLEMDFLRDAISK